jgi:dTDP-4-dehydrorhamnose 3,5-epimerase
MGRFQVFDTPLAGLKVVVRERRGDERGFLSRLYCAEELGAAGWRGAVAQVNHTLTRVPGTVRGMHFQHPPHAEQKLVSCLRGRVWDVAVDLRAGSPTRLRWHAEELSADNGRALLIPEGFAHGFQVLDPDSELLYLHSTFHAPQSEGAVNALDPRLAIAWPLPVGERSARDVAHPPIADDFPGIPA